jgi:hypothetical protein
MTESKKKPGVAFWATVVVVVVLVGYPLGFGPACWMNCRTGWIGRESLSNLYRPIIRLAQGNRNDTTSKIILWWASAGADEGTLAFVLDDHIEWGSEWRGVLFRPRRRAPPTPKRPAGRSMPTPARRPVQAVRK